MFETLAHTERYKELFPSELDFDLVSPRIRMQRGAEYEFRYTRLGISQLLGLRVTAFEEPREIQFEMILGFFRTYSHTVRLEVHSESATRISHFVEYQLPLGLVGKLYDDLHLRRYIESVLAHLNRSLSKIQSGS